MEDLEIDKEKQENVVLYSKNNTMKPRCNNCGKIGHATTACCADTKPLCNHCKKRGHADNECWSKHG